MRLFSLLFCSFFLFVSCKNNTETITQNTKKSNSVKDAKGFYIENHEDYTKLVVTQAFPKATKDFEYYLVSKQQEIPKELKGKTIIRTPIERVIVTSTTHVPMLELLGVENALVGFPSTQYVSSAKTRALIDNGKVREIGKNQDLNTEIIIELQPELIIGFALNSNNKTFDKVRDLGIPVVINGDWLEKTPLGKAEWIKFFAPFFDKQAKATTIFNNIKADYLDAKEIAEKADFAPTVLAGVQYNDAWTLPNGESFEAQLLKDANTNYLWKDTKGNASLALSFESVYEKAHNANFWIAPGHFTTKAQLLNNNAHYKQFEAFKNDNIYTFSNSKGAKGGVLYYELGIARPDLVLKDLIKIAHPTLLKDYEMTFYKKME